MKKFYLYLSVISLVYFLLMAVSDGPDASLLIIWIIIGGAFYLLALEGERPWTKKIPSWVFITVKSGIVATGCLFIIFCGFCIWGNSRGYNGSLDYIIILGAGVEDTEPSLSLEKRLVSAFDYMSLNPDTVAVTTGARDESDSISEAECSRNWLVDRGIDDYRIIMEDNSTSTEENFRYALNYIDTHTSNDNVKIGVVTNNFHVFRAMCVAEEIADGKYNFYGISADFPIMLLPHYSLREFLATCVYAIRGDLQLPD